ncbi:MAG: hypothetical protein KJ709_04330 [Nanoarchaeota archaeon]|nr:hypothetical protein [Nanoarchaeota archaeon]
MITKDNLLDWLKEVDRRLERRLMLIAVGGTAMTLLGLKPSTVDVDFCLSSDDAIVFERLTKGSRFKVDIFKDGFIFSEQLPEDYADKSAEVKTGLKWIDLRTLSLYDIIITKAARYNERDEEDIKAIAQLGKVDRKELIERFKKVVGTYAGRKDDYSYNFKIALRHF